MRVILVVLATGLAILVAAAPAWAADPPGLVAAYAFDEGSGVVVSDASGHGHLGTISGATWTAGRFGGALSFNGADASVLLGDLGTFYQGGFTLEAWVQKQSVSRNDVSVVGSWTAGGGGPMLWVDHVATRYQLTLNTGMSNYLDSGHNPVAGQWQHLAATFDGSTARFFIDGVQVASRAVSVGVGSSNIWRIGAYGSSPAGFFDGRIDNVRVYDRALSAGQIETDMNEPVPFLPLLPPTAPGNFAVSAKTQTSVSVQWDPSTDDTGVSGYNLVLDGTRVGTTTANGFTFSGLSCSTTYRFEVEAFDAAGNVSTRSLQNASTALCSLPVGLVAAYAFDEGSGVVVSDASGHGHLGTISGATWTAGRFGGALSFNGADASVLLGDLGTFYQGGFTLEAWVQKQSVSRNDVSVVGSWTAGGGGPMLWVDHVATRYQLTLNTGMSNYLDSGHNPVAGQWQHLAATFDGSTARFFIDGVQVASRAVSVGVGSSNIWRIGAYGSSPAGFFDGRIDNVRVYDRALSAGQIETDMNEPVTDVDPPPSVEIGAPTGGAMVSGQVTVAANANDNEAVVGVRFRVDGHDVGAEDTVSPYAVVWDTRGELNGTHTLTAVARDNAGNTTTAAAVVVTVSNTPVSGAGLRAAYGFDEGSGTIAVDSSGNNKTATVVGGSWASGHFGGAVSLDGATGEVDPPALGTFYKTGFTYEAWVYKQSAKVDVGVMGSWSAAQGGGAMLWVDHVTGHYRLTLGANFNSYLDSGQTPVVGQWQHLAATFDGSTARFFIDGVQVATSTFTGNVGDANIWRIGAYGSSPAGFFDGRIDNVRVYDRALSAGQIQADMASRIQPPPPSDTMPPTAPGNFAVSAKTQTSVSVQWDPSTDDTGVSGYNLVLDGTRVGTTTANGFTFSGLSCSTTYRFEVEAFDAAGNVSTRSLQNASTALCSLPVGLVAAYAFDEGSGVVVSDASGHGHLGTISGATWTAGRFGGALSFNGADASVLLGDLGTFYQGGFTLEAWVQKQSVSRNDVSVVGSWTAGGGGPMLWVDHVATRYQLTLNTGMSNYLDSGHNPVAGQWQHLAATFDGSTARFFIDGVQVASRAVSVGVGSSNIWRIGAYGSSPAGFFDGRIDNVRVYDRALSAGQIETDMNEPVTDVDPPPSVEIGAPTGGAMVSGQVTVAANANDNEAVVGVRFRVDGHDVGAEDTVSPYAVVWDTRGELNGTHTLTAVARDNAGNTTTAAAVVVTVSNTPVSGAGLRAAYGFDEGSGTIAVDSSGNNKTATVVGGSWASGHFGGAVSLDGATGEVDPPALGTFYKTGFTYEAWVYKQSAKVDVGVMGSWSAAQGGGAMLWVDHVTGHYRLTLGANFNSYLDSGQTPVVGQWQHLAATFDGSTARFFIDGVQVATSTFTGNVGDANIWRIGAYGSSPAGFFDGRIDNVRVYDRALSAGQIQADMASRIQPDLTPPAVLAKSPASGSAGVNVGSSVTVLFGEPMNASTVTSSTFQLRDGANGVVSASVSYDVSSGVATLVPVSALQYGASYSVVVKGGSGGVSDVAGNALVADVSWSFATEASPPPVLVVGSAGNRFGMYVGEILRNEGLNAFTTIDVSFLSPALLSGFDVVVLGDTPLSPAQVSALTGWVNGGGNLIAMRPDKQLAGLLGLSDAGSTLANGYLKVDTGVAPGAGIVGSTIQFHGTADRYALSGAAAVATLYSNATTATTSPAVTLRSVGSSGGQAAAFAYDLARSVVLTRQGNPAWAGQERDGVQGIRPDDLFFGAKAGDVQADWLDTSKIAIPQADEQQRLLVNMITSMVRDRMPLPHFWYLPRGLKAAVVMSGDDHGFGGTSFHFDRFKSFDPAGCVVANWECVRSTSYIYPNHPMTNAQAAAYIAQGFEVALHPLVLSCPPNPITEAELAAYFDTQLSQFHASYPSVPGPVSSRTHCVFWPDWLSSAKIELARGIRMDGNYYHFPDTWIGNKPGFMTGGGFPMRFADTDGSMLDIYQENTSMTDESGQSFPSTIDALLDNALGAQGFYGTFGVNMHTDYPTISPSEDSIIASAQTRGVPVISYKQLLDWTDGRNASTIRGLNWNAGTLTFITTIGAGANGLQTLLPTQGPTGSLNALSCAGTPKTYTLQTIKGIQYAAFNTTAGTCQATYS